MLLRMRKWICVQGKKRKKRTSWEVFSSEMAVFWQAGSSLLAWLGSAESQL